MPGFQARGRGLDESEAVGKEATDDLLPAVHHVPVTHRRCLFFSLIPHGTKVHKGRLADGFQDAQESAERDKCCEIFGDGVQSENNPPEDYGRSEILCDGEALDEAVGGVLDYENSDIDARCQPGKLLALANVLQKENKGRTCCPTKWVSFLIPIILAKLIVPLSSACRK